MYLTRPKSSKGRSRPTMNKSVCAGETEGARRPPASAEPPVHSRPDRNLRSLSHPVTWQTGQLSLLRHTPSAPPQSLNKYNVLPSIERRHMEVSPGRSLYRNMAKLSLCGGGGAGGGALQQSQKLQEPGPAAGSHAGSHGSLILAVRTACGRRFQQHFEPTDTLSKVKASAEARFGLQYDKASIETMDVPRRSFTDMYMTLEQCGILNKSVLCISQNNSSEAEHERA